MLTGMARIARIVAPGFPHHITHRGNRRQGIEYFLAKFLLTKLYDIDIDYPIHRKENKREGEILSLP